MSKLTLEQAQDLYRQSQKSDEHHDKVMGAVLAQLITHLDQSDKVVQIATMTNPVGASEILILLGNGTVWSKSNAYGSDWKELTLPK